jgi:hypothetical protein
VGGGQGNAKLFAERAEVVTAGGGHQNGGEFEGVDGLLILEETRFAQKADIKFDVMPEDGCIANEGDQFLLDVAQTRRLPDHGVIDAGQPGDEIWDIFAGVDEGVEFIFFALAIKTNRRNFNDRVAFFIQASGFDV